MGHSVAQRPRRPKKCRVGERFTHGVRGFEVPEGSILGRGAVFEHSHSIHGGDKVIPTGTCGWVVHLNEEHERVSS